MACYHPQRYFRGRLNPETGKFSPCYDVKQSVDGVPRLRPCQQCIGCKLERSRQWAVRMMHEVKSHDASAFLTLTYRPDALPPGGSLVRRDMTLFMKRLRKRRPKGLRFYVCGEYGDDTGRPHYHVLLFNTDFPDRKYLRMSKSGEVLYHSAELSSIWTAGSNAIGSVTFDSCAYVARYCVKKLGGPMGAMYYSGAGIEPEFGDGSNGIGAGWFDRFKDEFYRHDSAVMNGREVRLPRYYDVKWEAIDRKRFLCVKFERKRKAALHAAEQTVERRRVRERFAELSHRRFSRET